MSAVAARLLQREEFLVHALELLEIGALQRILDRHARKFDVSAGVHDVRRRLGGLLPLRLGIPPLRHRELREGCAREEDGNRDTKYSHGAFGILVIYNVAESSMTVPASTRIE